LGHFLDITFRKPLLYPPELPPRETARRAAPDDLPDDAPRDGAGNTFAGAFRSTRDGPGARLPVT